MPEGDTIHRTALTLHKALGGQVIARCTSQLVVVSEAGLEGRTVTDVTANGKNLLIHFDDGRALHTHMRMHGSWHIYRPLERWRRSPRNARVVLATEGLLAVCFSAPVVRLIAAGTLERDEQIASIGPDLLHPAFDLPRALMNLRASPSAEVGDAILQQRLVAGIGNVFKSECLFVCKVNPFARVEELPDEALTLVLEKARQQLTRSVVVGGPRRTRLALTGPRAWVYLRAGSPCLVCGTIVRMQRQGSQHRSTYFCPQCQGTS